MSALVEHVQLPTRHAVRQLLEGLVDRDLTIADGSPVPARTTNLIALYVTPKLATLAIAVMDLEGAARLGGAVGGIGRVLVEECVAGRRLTPALSAATERALTGLSSTFGSSNGTAARLYQVYGPNDVVPADVARLTGLARGRLDLALRIAGYGAGQLSIVVA